mmetsp:Transcript_21857/g.74111  ORF Transcript_21857/g.74111 Transcript_21857/m.74111 type:complete len:247 (+) Transcript_21857:55-795(+)
MAGIAGERNHVSDVFHAGDEHDQALEAEAEAGVRHRPVLPQLQIPRQRGRVDPNSPTAFLQRLQVVLALRAADQLADFRDQHVHRGDRFPVRVELHVKSFDVLWIIHQHHRCFINDVRQVSLVLAAEVHAPHHVHILKLGTLFHDFLLQELDGRRVLQNGERRVDDVAQSLAKAGAVLERFEKLEVVVTSRKSRRDAVLQVVLRQLNVVVDVGKGDLRLDHPKLGQMPRSVRVLRAERRPERVAVA